MTIPPWGTVKIFKKIKFNQEKLKKQTAREYFLNMQMNIWVSTPSTITT